MRSIALAAMLALCGAAAHAQPLAVDVATISMSAPGVPRTVTDTICATDGNDLVCDRSVYLTSNTRVGIGISAPAAILHVSGSVLAQNGEITQSGLNGGYGSFRAISGNYGVLLRNDGTDFYILQTANGDQYGSWNDARPFGFNLSTGNVFLANSLSTSVAIGTSGVPSAKLDVKGTLRVSNGWEACDANRTGAIRFTGGDFWFCRNGSAWESMAVLSGNGGLADRIVSGTSAVVVNSATGIVSITQLGSVASYVHPSLGFVGPGVSTTGRVSSTGSYLAATANQCLTLADEGLMFRNATTRKLQVCVIRY